MVGDDPVNGSAAGRLCQAGREHLVDIRGPRVRGQIVGDLETSEGNCEVVNESHNSWGIDEPHVSTQSSEPLGVASRKFVYSPGTVSISMRSPLARDTSESMPVGLSSACREVTELVYPVVHQGR